MNKVSGTNFKKTKLIHSGDDVHIYEGLHTNFGRQVVIKELSGEANEIVRRDFFKEAKLWAKFEHSRLGRIEEINEDRGWVVTEFLPLAFNERIYGEPDLAALKQATMQILDGLGFLHSQGLLHCNLNAENIRYCEGTEAIKIMDGRGVAINEATQLPRPKGSNKYRAPEMLDNRFGPVGMATDLYLAATVVLEALAGNKFDSLFQGYVEGTPDPETGWFRWHNSDDQLEPIKNLIPGVPEDFARLLDDMLSKNVRSRVGTARDAMTELQAMEMEGQLSAPEPTPKAGSNAPGAKLNKGAAPPPPSGLVNSAGASPQLISRPSAPAYIRIASGTMAGTIIPVQLEDIVIGEGEHCNVKLSANDYERIRGREVSIVLGTGGWKISETKRPEDCSETIFVGSQPCQTNLPVRSGDIIRLSNAGPDLQFVIQGESTWAWQDVADELNMSATGGSKPPAKPKPQPRAQSGSGTLKLGSAPVPAPSGQAKPSAAPKTAAPPKKAKPVQPQVSAPAQPVAAAPMPAPVNSSAPAPPKPKKAKKSNSNQPSKPRFDKESGGGGISEWFSDKDKRNWLILIGGLILTAIIVPLTMGGGGEADEKNKEDPKVENSKSDDGDATPKATDPNPDETADDEAKEEASSETDQADE